MAAGCGWRQVGRRGGGQEEGRQGGKEPADFLEVVDGHADEDVDKDEAAEQDEGHRVDGRRPELASILCTTRRAMGGGEEEEKDRHKARLEERHSHATHTIIR